ncbi:MAG: HAD hydrolase family protein [Ignavibacteriales bacterium]|nr:HAD hydrolase family protein [Ignavibacteriales bacterium]
MKSELLNKFREIKIFLFDLDGVLMNDGESAEKCTESVAGICNEFKLLDAMFGIVTARSDDKLIDKLKTIENCFVLNGTLDKVSMVNVFLNSRSIIYQNVFYMGDSILDIPLLQKCGLSCAPKSARREVKRAVSFSTNADNCEELLKEILNYYKKSKEPASRATKY